MNLVGWHIGAFDSSSAHEARNTSSLAAGQLRGPEKGVKGWMKLLTEEIRKQLPPLYSQENVKDPLVICKFFYPDFNWTWYAIEGSPVDSDGYYDTDKEKVDFLFFGYVAGFECELGYFSLNELLNNRGKLGFPIERDVYFTPKPLSEIRKLHER